MLTFQCYISQFTNEYFYVPWNYNGLCIYSLITTISFTDIDNDKLSGIPHSTTGSLSSIITTSIASSEPDPGSEKVGCDVHGYDEKAALNRPGLRHEPWWHILLQVSIPFFIAGVGTIGAGIVLGRVEVSQWHYHR